MIFYEAKTRSIIKAISWRVWATLTTIAIVLLFTGRWRIAAAIGGVEVIAKLILYFIHERVWDKFHWGKVQLSPFVLWFTGLPSSGKSTLADEVAGQLQDKGIKLERLDGDIVREIFPKTGFSREDRNMHIRRIGFLCGILEKNGVCPVASFVSPYRESRDFVRRMTKNFIEIHVATPLEVCEERDVKGLYKRARAGEIKQFTGIDDPYEVPIKPELVIETHQESIKDSAKRVVSYLNRRGFIR
jgi:adenylylsulfate kinase